MENGTPVHLRNTDSSLAAAPSGANTINRSPSRSTVSPVAMPTSSPRTTAATIARRGRWASLRALPAHLLSAATYLERIRRRLVSVCRLSVDFQDGGGHPRLEAMLPSRLQEALCDAFPPVEREAMVEAAKRMADLFRQVARPLAARRQIAYPDALEQTVLAWFDKEFARLDRQATG